MYQGVELTIEILREIQELLLAQKNSKYSFYRLVCRSFLTLESAKKLRKSPRQSNDSITEAGATQIAEAGNGVIIDLTLMSLTYGSHDSVVGADITEIDGHQDSQAQPVEYSSSHDTVPLPTASEDREVQGPTTGVARERTQSA